MKGEDLFDALGKIDDKLIEEAMPDKIHSRQKKIIRWTVSIAACICLLMIGSYVRDAYIENHLKLAKLDIGSIVFEPMGMGYEGTDDLSLKNSDNINPWTKHVNLETLPVYKNLRYNNGKLSQNYYSTDDLKKHTETFAEFMGLDIIGGAVVAGEEENEIYNYILQTEQGQVSTNGAGISFNIKKGYEHLSSEHTLFCSGSESEKISGVYREYSVDGELLSEEIRCYCKHKTLVDNIIAFNLQSHYEVKGENYTNSRSDDFISSSLNLGDYPIITWQEAQKKLLKGEYVSSADESQVIGGKLSKDAIAEVDLIYYTNGNPELYLPYYRFLVKYNSADSDNKRYAYFYICAVYDKYLVNYEKFDGSYQ